MILAMSCLKIWNWNILWTKICLCDKCILLNLPQLIPTVTEIRGLFCACELVSGNCETSIRYYSAAEPNFLFDVVRREQWRLWSKRCKHLFASRSLPAWLNWNVSEESVFLHPPHSAQHMCACIEHRRGAGEAFFCSSLLTTHQGTGCGELFFRSKFFHCCTYGWCLSLIEIVS